MGYGHQRTAFPLKFLAENQVININDYEGIPLKDRQIWESIRKGYEFTSNFKRVPVLGDISFFMMDRFQKILTFYPRRDLSEPNAQLKQTIATIKSGWGRALIEKLKKNPLPLICSFFTPAYMAEYFNYPGEIFCIVCDADVSRTWAPFNPETSKIKYLAPTERVVERLRLYGVKSQNILFTGFPLPKELIGTENMEILKEDLKFRLLNLDPKKRYFEKYKISVDAYLGKLPESPDHPLTILFSIGGAGAQKEIAFKIIKSLFDEIKSGRLRVILSAGIKEEVKNYFEEKIKKSALKDRLGRNIEILYCQSVEDYFKKFNEKLRKTDILWTKPSELSFYAALGIPIIIAPTIGSQEEFNMRWLLKSGFGIFQENPNFANQWFFDWLRQGYLAEAAMQGFIEGEKLGTFRIQRII